METVDREGKGRCVIHKGRKENENENENENERRSFLTDEDPLRQPQR